MKRTFPLTCIAALIVAATSAEAGSRAGRSGSSSSIASTSPGMSRFSASSPSRFSPAFSRSPGGLSQVPGGFGRTPGGINRSSRTAITRNFPGTGRTTRTAATFPGRGNGNGNGNGNGGHHHHRCRTNIVFFDSFGYPFYWWGYPYNAWYPYDYYPDEEAYAGQSVDEGGPDMVAQVQRQLARAGYYRGTIDGIMGPATERAIRGYERAHNLPVDGALSDQLLEKMNLQ